MTLNPLFPTVGTLGINTDLYELTMAAAYFESGRIDEIATFELYTRRLPENRSFLIAAGLEQALHYALNVSFSPETVSYLRRLDTFRHVSDDFFDYLAEFRFTGDIWAQPEGSVFFENEPVIQVRAPIIESQLLETYLINSVNVQSMIASKAARMCLAARDRAVVDFGSRRAHGPQTGVLAARACYIGGCVGTSNVLAGFEMGIPVFGTMAHSFVQAFDNEVDAFEAFLKVFPDRTILLIDTYDSIQGVQKALELKGQFQGVRLDSGDLAGLSSETRKMLDRAGRRDAKIFVSSSLNEQKLLSYSLQDLPIDGYGVGTEMVVSSDAPSCDLVYKMVEVIRDGKAMPRFKASEGKTTLPNRKQVYRRTESGRFVEDFVAIEHEEAPDSMAALLKKYVEAGRLLRDLPTVHETREFSRGEVEKLPQTCKHLHTIEWYPVKISEALQQAFNELEAKYTQ